MTYEVKRSSAMVEWNRLQDFFKQHWEEVGCGDIKSLTLDIHKEYYRTMENHDKYLAIGIYKDGVLVGYISYIIGLHPHHTVNFGLTDCFFLSKEHRTTGGKKALIKGFKLAEDILKYQYRCRYVQLVTADKNPLEGLAKILKYQPVDRVYVKEV